MDIKRNRVMAYGMEPSLTKSCHPIAFDEAFTLIPVTNEKHYIYDSAMPMTTKLDIAMASGKGLIHKVT